VQNQEFFSFSEKFPSERKRRRKFSAFSLAAVLETARQGAGRIYDAGDEASSHRIAR
jgi:hypothetical protein